MEEVHCILELAEVDDHRSVARCECLHDEDELNRMQGLNANQLVGVRPDQPQDHRKQTDDLANEGHQLLGA